MQRAVLTGVVARPTMLDSMLKHNCKVLVGSANRIRTYVFGMKSQRPKEFDDYTKVIDGKVQLMLCTLIL